MSGRGGTRTEKAGGTRTAERVTRGRRRGIDPEPIVAAVRAAVAEASRSHGGAPDAPLRVAITVDGRQVDVRIEDPSAAPADFPSWFRATLEARGVTQGEASDLLDVSRRTVCRWLAGDTSPRFDELQRLERVFGRPAG